MGSITTSSTSSSSVSSPTVPLINYFSRDFTKLRADLITYVQNYHADKFAYFNDASPDMMYLEMLAYFGDVFNYQLDKAFNESFRGTAQSRESLIRIAQDFGFYNYFPKPASSQVVLAIDVPAVPNSDGSAMIPDPRYLVSIYSGMRLESNNGTTFESIDEVNFASGLNRTIVPNYDANNKLINFTVKKSVVVTAGVSKIQRFYVNNNNIAPFLEITLTDNNVTEILGVVVVPGNTFVPPDDSAFRSDVNTYTEVEHLAQDSIFVDINPTDNTIQNLLNAYTDMSINYGEWVNKPKRFIVRRDRDNNTKLIFGSTLIDYSAWTQLIGTTDVSTLANFSLSQVLNNSALGEIPPVNSTLFIKYRAGAGVSSNALYNQITDITDKQFFDNTTASDFSVLDRVRQSLRVDSNLPAIGGTDPMTNEEIRHSVGKVFAANDRAVVYEDVKALINAMPARFGQPFRISYEEIKPKVLNYTQIQNYVSAKLDELLALPMSTDRINKSTEIKTFMQNILSSTVQIDQNGNPITLATSSNQILQNTPSLWLGEKCRLYVLGIDQDFQPTTIYKDTKGVWQSPNELLKQNIKNYLISKRVIGDWIDIVDASVVNFQVEFTIMADRKNKQKVLIDCLTTLRNYFDVHNWQINQPIFVANVNTILQEIDGVINVVSLKFNNVFGTDVESNKEYSPPEIGRYFNNTTNALNTSNNKFVMNTTNNVIMSRPDTFLCVKYPDIDIRGFVL